MANTTKVSIFTRKYLTNDELAYIVNEVIKHDNAVVREIVKVGMVAQLVVKDLGEFDDCNGVYDYVMEKGIDLNEIVNYKTLNDLIDAETGVTKIIKDFVTDMTERINKSIENLDLNGAISQLKEISEKKVDEIDVKPKSTRKK